MAADAAANAVSRELKSLQDELSAAQRQRLGAPAVAPPTIGSAEPVKESPETRELQNQLRELADEITQFFEEAETQISAHPAQSIAGALVVGILIGFLLGRR